MIEYELEACEEPGKLPSKWTERIKHGIYGVLFVGALVAVILLAMAADADGKPIAARKEVGDNYRNGQEASTRETGEKRRALGPAARDERIPWGIPTDGGALNKAEKATLGAPEAGLTKTSRGSGGAGKDQPVPLALRRVIVLEYWRIWARKPRWTRGMVDAVEREMAR